MNRFRGGLVFKAHRLVYHSTLGLRVIKKKKSITQGEMLRFRRSLIGTRPSCQGVGLSGEGLGSESDVQGLMFRVFVGVLEGFRD